MAERRMFAKTIIDSDAFLDMSCSAQCLYFHLAMRADDDGFINNPRKIQRIVGAGDDDMRILVAKKFIIPFDSGIVVIKHWRIHNYIQKDRYKPTVYQDEKSMLAVKENNSYSLVDTECIQNVSKLETQVRLGKDRKEIGEDRLVEGIDSIGDKPHKHKFSPPSVDDVRAYCQQRNNSVDPVRFVDYYTSNGWRVGKNPMKDWKAAVRTWEGNSKKEETKQETAQDRWGFPEL